jgi:hypothetical protein
LLIKHHNNTRYENDTFKAIDGFPFPGFYKPDQRKYRNLISKVPSCGEAIIFLSPPIRGGFACQAAGWEGTIVPHFLYFPGILIVLAISKCWII